MLRPYLKIWEWELIIGRAVKAISSPGVRSLCLRPMAVFIVFWPYLSTTKQKISFGTYALQFLTIIFLATDGVLIFAQREKSSFDPSCFASGSFQTLWLWFLKVLSPCKGKGSSFNSKKNTSFISKAQSIFALISLYLPWGPSMMSIFRMSTMKPK